MKFPVSGKILVLFVAFSLLTSVGIGTSFADDDKKKKTFEEMCAKKKGNSPDALFCQAILGLQQSTDSFFDIFTELQESTARSDSFFDIFFDVFPDTPDKSGIDSFFDVFTELRATDTSLQTQIDSFENQDCPDGYYVYGIDDNGKIKCKPLPSAPFCGDGITTAPEICDDGNNTNGDGCSEICTAETIDLCLGVDVDDGNECTTDSCSAGIAVHIDNGFCTEAVCGDGLVSGAEQCDDGNTANGDGCSDVCSIEGCNADANPLCSTSVDLGTLSGDSGNEIRTYTNHSEKWFRIILEDSVLGGNPEAAISLDSGSNDYDLYIYCESCGSVPIGSSTMEAGITDVVSVFKDGGVFSDDTFTVLVEVRAVSVNSCSDYTLTIAGNTVIGTPVGC